VTHPASGIEKLYFSVSEYPLRGFLVFGDSLRMFGNSPGEIGKVMGIRFDEQDRREWYEILQFCGETMMILRLCPNKDYWRITKLHWLPEHRKSVPCLYEDCPWCNSPVRWCTYVPVLLLAVSSRAWVRKVLAVTDGMRACLDLVEDGLQWRLHRRNGKRGRIVSSYEKLLPAPPSFVPFDVEPSLRRLWGVDGVTRKAGSQHESN